MQCEEEKNGSLIDLLLFTQTVGKNDGSVQGRQNFKCATNFGLFVKPNAIQLEQQNNTTTDTATTNSKTITESNEIEIVQERIQSNSITPLETSSTSRQQNDGSEFSTTSTTTTTSTTSTPTSATTPTTSTITPTTTPVQNEKVFYNLSFFPPFFLSFVSSIVQLLSKELRSQFISSLENNAEKCASNLVLLNSTLRSSLQVVSHNSQK
jgi:hypothetical protein